ncbi:MAG: electron transfer flavoprotein subunit alpha/FixB family protein [Gammaproteobacteria bacterium]
MKTLVIAEHDQNKLKNSSFATLSAALQLSDVVDILVVGYQCAAVAQEAAQLAGVATVHCADDPSYEHILAENIVPLIEEITSSYSHILAPATTFGKNFMPRLAAKLGVEQIGDVLKIVAPDIFVRPIYAGNALTEVQSSDFVKLLTIRPTAFSNCTTFQTSASINPLKTVYTSTQVSWVREESQPSERPELGSARVVISGGRGLQSAENFHLLESLAQKLNAAIGASRAAVDAGFVPNDYQVGQTGKVVAPELYIAVGISGAIQHLAGMKDSKVIVAINKDPDAPIFQIADYGLVGDLFEILPELDKALDLLHNS